MHITASVFINDDESGLHQDYERWLEQLAPHEPVVYNPTIQPETFDVVITDERHRSIYNLWCQALAQEIKEYQSKVRG